MIQGSINTLEFNLSSGIKRSTSFEPKGIAILEGHGELEDLAMADLVSTLEEDHLVARVKLDGRLNVLSEKLDGMRYRVNRYDLLIVAKPDSSFSDKDKVILDQFVMNGGRVLWMVDPVLTDLDSLRNAQETFGVENDLRLYDQLFDYGVRLNRNLIIDPQCAPIMLDAGPMGNQRNMQLFNWYFAPLAMPLGTGHPITNNLDPIHFDFVSSMDLVNTQEEVQSTVLLTSSERAKTYRVPVRISSGIVDLDPGYFAEGNTPNEAFAVLLEGSFRSHFAQSLPAILRDDPDFAFRAQGAPSAMVVISDGDVAKNKFRSDGKILPLGYDRYARRVVYDNKEFLMNAINYLLQEDALISVRSRSIALRPLDEERIRQERQGWQFVAVGMPLLVVFHRGRGGVDHAEAVVWARRVNDLRIMHANLRILYVLIALTMVTAGVWWFQGGQGNLAQIEGTDFAIADTSTVDKIFIADMDGGQVTLTRPTQGSLWDVNGQFKAREDAVNLLLKTFLRARVQGPVAEAAQPNVIRLLSARGKKVEIYQGGDAPTKTWYVGTATPSHTGTYMVLETPEGRGCLTLCRAHGGIHGIPQHEVFHFRAGMAPHGDFQFPGAITCRCGSSGPRGGRSIVRAFSQR